MFRSFALLFFTTLLLFAFLLFLFALFLLFFVTLLLYFLLLLDSSRCDRLKLLEFCNGHDADTAHHSRTGNIYQRTRRCYLTKGTINTLDQQSPAAVNFFHTVLFTARAYFMNCGGTANTDSGKRRAKLEPLRILLGYLSGDHAKSPGTHLKKEVRRRFIDVVVYIIIKGYGGLSALRKESIINKTNFDLPVNSGNQLIPTKNR
ncbi:hypothetical protein D0S45_04005 [Marinifilum sp. JC120]|nr:hypothetical protein D0S45_04005 [Marinifilum sp. JC120]